MRDFFFLLQRPLLLQFYLTELSEWVPGGNVLKTDLAYIKGDFKPKVHTYLLSLTNQIHDKEQETHEVGYSRE